MDGKGPSQLRPGQVGRTARSRIRPFPPCIIALSRMLLAYIHRSITHRVHFLDNARSHLLGACSFAPKICLLKPRKWQVPKELIGRRLSQAEAKKLLAKFEHHAASC